MLFSLLLATAISQPFVRADNPQVAPVVTKRIVIIGSSVAAGMGASTYFRSWVGLLSEALRSDGWQVLNRSIPGNNTTDVLARLQRDALSLKPTIVVVTLGFHNEGLTRAWDPDAVFNQATENLLAMVAQIRAAGAVPVLGGVYPNNHWGDSERSYLLNFYIWAYEHNLPTLDFLTTTEDGHGRWREGLYADNCHPNDAGHEAMFKSIPPDFFDQVLRLDLSLRSSRERRSSKTINVVLK